MAARRDSLDAARAQDVQELSQRIAGYENRRAEDEYTNVLLLKDTTAAELLKVMDSYGHALSVGCNYCHVPGKWDEDTKEEKKTARVMIALVDSVNDNLLSKMPPNRRGDTPKISCVTCHRGSTHPNGALLP
jgi:photosynthetic reaction center cytochrome c subunit